MDPLQLLQAIYEQVNTLQEHITRLSQEVSQLRADNDNLRSLLSETKFGSALPRRLTYNIQNLNVKTLSGTLNVGLVTGATEEQVLEHLSEFGVASEEPQEQENEETTA